MRSHLRSPWLAAAVVLMLSGCATLKSLLAQAFVQPKLTFRDAKLSGMSLDSATIDLTFDLDNPNAIGLSLAELDYAFFVEGKQVVAGKPKQGLTVPANGKTQLTFPATVKFADIAPVVTTFLTKDQAAYKAQGSVGVKTPIGLVRLPLSHEGSFEVPKIPEVAFGTPRFSLQGFAAKVEFPVTVKNKNSYPLPIQGLVGGILVAGTNVGDVSTGDLGPLAGKGEKQLTVPLTIQLAQAASAVRAMQSGSTTVKFDGQLLSGAGKLPLQFQQRLSFR